MRWDEHLVQFGLGRVSVLERYEAHVFDNAQWGALGSFAHGYYGCGGQPAGAPKKLGPSPTKP
ncbi:MAG TPA: hypothetical protein VME46_18495 [Acidimicrobiales bacterium]|nr:hypothetical protein [Acidimicrobiales bacterium]